ncbi:hypothetical protein EJ06DRAFT_394124 [Trichodelitschia bisporula]|uniref:Uncharacterized protein n=1 Tax=Trichodelitschia bisporula TaxID=703511 RepID=A0A6G1HZK8_9PEZI|nr:hypothetical protein EJ06DRAFT_394124 [Trichodelitschia bisporula]
MLMHYAIAQTTPNAPATTSHIQSDHTPTFPTPPVAVAFGCLTVVLGALPIPSPEAIRSPTPFVCVVSVAEGSATLAAVPAA